MDIISASLIYARPPFPHLVLKYSENTLEGILN